MKEHRTFLDFPAKTFHAVTISISTLRKFGSVFFLSKENTTYASQIFAAIHFRKQKSLWKNKALCILLHRQHFAMNCSCSLFFLFVLQKCCLNCFASYITQTKGFSSWKCVWSSFKISGEKAHATSKHQDRLRCRWTLCSFITHALNLLAVTSLSAGEGICGHLTSCSQSLLWQMAKNIYFIL